MLVYRLFDVADAVDLARAEALAAAPAGRLKIDRAVSASAIEFPRPPLHLALGQRELDLPGGRVTATATAHLFDYGVVSVRHAIPVEPGTTLEALVPMAEWLLAGDQHPGRRRRPGGTPTRSAGRWRRPWSGPIAGRGTRATRSSSSARSRGGWSGPGTC